MPCVDCLFIFFGEICVRTVTHFVLSARVNTPTMKICLCMIVKDESHIIAATLRNVLDCMPVCAYSVCDTGSTDDTAAVILSFMASAQIPGSVHNCEWRDFGFNRTEAMQKARGVAEQHGCDFILMHDADDLFSARVPIPAEATADAYLLQFGPGTVYSRLQLFRVGLDWAYEGVLHECAYCRSGKVKESGIGGEYFVHSGRAGNRNKSEVKYEQDARVLEKALGTELDPSLRSRYKFYLAQSYRDAGDRDRAAEAYKAVLDDPEGWSQEKYCACLELANLLPEKLHWWMKSVQYDHQRIEGVARAAEYLRNEDNHHLVAALYKQFRGYGPPTAGKLFVATDDYNLQLEYEASVSCFYSGDKQLGHEACEKCVMKTLRNSLRNWKFYAPRLKITAKHELTRSQELSVPHNGGVVVEKLRSSTPSIISMHGGGYRVNIPMHNYSIDGDNYFHGDHSPSFYTTNHCMHLSPTFQPCGTSHTFIEQYNGVQNSGLENLRVLPDGRFTANERQADGNNHIVIGEYDCQKTTLERSVLPRFQECEKNWVHLCGDEFVYGWHPLKLCMVDGKRFRFTNCIDTPVFFENVRGSTDFSGGFALVHIVSFEDARRYYHALVHWDGSTLRYSPPFTFEGARVEYCTGLIAEPERLVITYSTMDVKAYVATLDRDVAESMLKFSCETNAPSIKYPMYVLDSADRAKLVLNNGWTQGPGKLSVHVSVEPFWSSNQHDQMRSFVDNSEAEWGIFTTGGMQALVPDFCAQLAKFNPSGFNVIALGHTHETGNPGLYAWPQDLSTVNMYMLRRSCAQQLLDSHGPDNIDAGLSLLTRRAFVRPSLTLPTHTA